MIKFLSKNGKFYMRDGKLLQKSSSPLAWFEANAIPQ